MTSQWILVLASCLILGTGRGTQAYDSALYEDMLFQDLYKRLTEMEPAYYPVDENNYSGSRDSSPYNWDDVIPLGNRDSGQADIRDPEFLAHSSIGDGFQYISGGAGEGKQHLKPEGTLDNPQEVKSDDVLPFYCHPPNPCPKGFKAEDGCTEDIKDDAEVQKDWISKMQDKGMCTCDEEHMFDCPGKGGAMSENGMPPGGDEDLDNFISSILGDDKENPYSSGNKMEKIVSKKSPRIRRSVSKGVGHQKYNNPYLQGNKIHVIAKKGVHMD